jgi:hypothetical protein
MEASRTDQWLAKPGFLSVNRAQIADEETTARAGYLRGWEE